VNGLGETRRPDEARPAPRVAIVILHWGPVDVTTRCLESLHHASFPGKKTVVLIDNAGTLDGSAAASADLDVEIDRPGRNLGFAGGCVRGIAIALEHGADYVLLLNNDVTVDPFFLEALLEEAYRNPGAGLLCPRIVSMADPARAWYIGGTFSLWAGIPVQTRAARGDGARPREVDYATGCAMLMTPAVIRAVGSFDPDLFAYCEDLDLSLRARKAGFKVVFVPVSVVYHAVNDRTDRAWLRIYYSTRNLLEVMRRHAAWYHWAGFLANFLVRWVGRFAVLACVRRQPRLIGALACGAADFVRGRLGERRAVPAAPRVVDPRR
jgi:GT2 family glycosyltransferase